MELKNAIPAFLALVIVALLIVGCGGITENNSAPPDPPKNPYPETSWSPTYPTSMTDMYFAKPQDGFPEYVGLAGFVLDRGDARWLGTSPGYHFYNGHMGGLGDTLEVMSETNGIYLRWAYNLLMVVEVFEGWQGQVMTSPTQKTGIRIGSTITSFKATFPDTVLAGTNKYNGNSYCTTFLVPVVTVPNLVSTYNLYAECDSSGIIKKLRVDPFEPIKSLTKVQTMTDLAKYIK